MIDVPINPRHVVYYLILSFTHKEVDEWRAHVCILLSILCAPEKLVGCICLCILSFSTSYSLHLRNWSENIRLDLCTLDLLLLLLYFFILKTMARQFGGQYNGWDKMEGKYCLLSSQLLCLSSSGASRPGPIACMANTLALQPLTCTNHKMLLLLLPLSLVQRKLLFKLSLSHRALMFSVIWKVVVFVLSNEYMSFS